MRESLRSGRHGRAIMLGLCAALVGGQALAEISITDHNAMLRQQRFQARHHGVHIMATGDRELVDAAGLKYFLNDNITFSTSSSASGAVSEASYTQSVAETTASGGTTMVRMNDAFDGYGALCVSFTGATGPCGVRSADYVVYNKNGAATAETSCNSRQYDFNPQTMGQLRVTRKFFVPSNDTFGRWLNYFTNTGSSAVTFNVITSNNLGSDSNTTIVTSSNGGAIDTGTTWVSTFDNYAGSDPRLGHVLQGPGAATPVSAIHFANGDDNPYWAYTVTLQPGETKAIMTFVTGQPSKAAANAKAAELVSLPPNAVQCMTAADMAEVTNFAAAPQAAIPALDRIGFAALALLLTAAGVVALKGRSA